MIKTICIAGDSHAWGQGAKAELLPHGEEPFEPSDKRLLSFGVPSFASLLRNYINEKSGSQATEFSAKDISRLCGAELLGECAKVCGEIKIHGTFDFARVEVRNSNADTEILCGGTAVHKCGNGGDKYDVINILPKSRSDELVIRSDGALVYRVELYAGEYAVLNCGIGSCTSELYTDKYLEKYVLDVNPHCVIAEAFTVNDWLGAKAISDCEKSLEKFGRKILAGNCALLFSSVIPILGEQANSAGLAYRDYVLCAERVAHSLGIAYADVYCAFSKEYAQTPTLDHYADNWHPGPRGHEIYFEVIKRFV